MTLAERASAAFWPESLWLPPGTVWADLAEPPHTIPKHLLYPLPMALGMLALRFLLERFWFAPAGISVGIRNARPKRAEPEPTLEVAYAASSKLKRKQAAALAEPLGWTDRRVERWWRKRRNQDRPSTLVKFCENAWRCTYYIFSTAFGAYVLWNKSWLWDVDHCYLGYPHQGVTGDVWWYYMISLSFYWSLAISQFFDVKRKDFWQMFVHHIATITLMSFSWICNLHRVGTLVLLVHDCADIFLEAAKMTKYANYQKLCDCIFGVFTVLWIVTRLGIFPFYIIWSTTVRAPMLLPMFPAYYFFNGLLCLLLFLHVIWTWLILKVAYKALAAGQMEGDIRSSSSEVSDSSDEPASEKSPKNNQSALSAEESPLRRRARDSRAEGER